MGANRSRSVGKGLSRREIDAPSETAMSPDEILAALRQFTDSREAALASLWGQNAEVIQQLSKLADKAREQVGDSVAWNGIFKEYESLEWYAHMVDTHRKVVERAVQAGRMNEAVQEAVRVGQLLAELTFKGKWDSIVYTGEKVQAAARLGGEMKRDCKAARDAEIRRAFKDGMSRGRNSSALKRAILEKYRGEIGRRQLDRILK